MNRHFAKLADVWKHLVLAELLARELPARYAETHAGSASYALIDDAERRFGVRRFLDCTDPTLTQSAYRQRIEPLVRAGQYPGSAALAMLSLPRDRSYLLCDLDPHSAADLRSFAAAYELTSCDVVERDGMAATLEWIASLPSVDGVVVHIDPFDPHDRSGGSYSATELAMELIRRGITVAYWYGYDEPAKRSWPDPQLPNVWCGDVMVVDETGAGSAGDLGVATSAGTGCGMLLGHAQPATVEACERLGAALADAYAGARLPDGTVGGLSYRSSP